MHRNMLVCLATSLLLGSQSSTHYLSFPEAQPLIAAFVAIGEKTPVFTDASQWDQWIRGRDAEIRTRIDRGVEDSISNLIAYGMSFTTLPKLAAVEDAVTPAGDLTLQARTRTHALVSSLDHSDNERLRFVRDFLVRHKTHKSDVEAVLAANLRRFALEQAGYQHTLKAAGPSGDQSRVLPVPLFAIRGLSADPSLLPNFPVEDPLR